MICKDGVSLLVTLVVPRNCSEQSWHCDREADFTLHFNLSVKTVHLPHLKYYFNLKKNLRFKCNNVS